MNEQSLVEAHVLSRKQKNYLIVKRILDLFMSVSAVIVLSPLLFGIAIAIKRDSKGPVFFKQKRVGKDKKLFEIYKFRTMRTDTPKNMPTHMLAEPDQYITKIGSLLRKTSLDELPQIFNIIKNDMYIVAPRPALWNQYDLIEKRDEYGVHQIAPGLTGWAQINGRDELEIPVKAKLDKYYIEHMGLQMDCYCILKTIISVLKHEGVIEGGTGKMKK
ncbi:sugar transferase [Clostridium transplantifaecale]|uniref:sugar transferase n=1 Tax=Clostridium transplantifaecale TaxID=2479838 RepID=UPI000F640AD5|nr:sugar transferase [Clostridium transplantifaecale]